jgi:hypothetical protein
MPDDASPTTMVLLRDAISVPQLSRVDMLRWQPSPACATGSDDVNIKGTLHKASTEPQLRYLGTTRHVWRL